eukprot:scaffold50392_cov52-Attheya_sp.AAC.2
MAFVDLGDHGTLALTAAVVVLTTIVLMLGSRRIHRITKSRAARQKIDELAANNKEPKEAPTVSSLFVHPVKSLRAVSVPSAALDELGLKGDRRLMIVRPCPPSASATTDENTATHRFVTQRQFPGLTSIEASLPSSSETHNTTIITLKSSAVPGSQVNIDVSEQTLKSHKHRYRAGIWDDVVTVVDVGDDAASFVKNVLLAVDEGGQEPFSGFENIRVVSIVPDVTVRKTPEEYVPPEAWTVAGSIPNVALTDGFPILVACEASLNELNRRLQLKGKPPIPMSRFRPNIVIRNPGGRPFEEDQWKAIKIGDNTILHMVKGCPRCKQSCTDQLTGERFEEPIETLADFRALGKNKEDVYFAQNAVFHGGSGSGCQIKVGDTVSVLSYGDPVWDLDPVQAE